METVPILNIQLISFSISQYVRGVGRMRVGRGRVGRVTVGEMGVGEMGVDRMRVDRMRELWGEVISWRELRVNCLILIR